MDAIPYKRSVQFHIITLFPDFFTGPLTTGVLGRAQEEKHIQVHFHYLVDFLENPKKRVDDIPYGGGAGMVLRPEVVARAIEHAKTIAPTAPVIHFSPRGKRFTQAKAETFSTKYDHYILLCGRYEGIDQRVIEAFVDTELCVGDVILSGGEFPALFFIDSITRLIPGVLGNHESFEEESFSKSLGRKKEYPHYTRPEIWRNIPIPDVLKSGHHNNIEKWRKNSCL